MSHTQYLANQIRALIDKNNETVKELESLLREARTSGLEVEMLDGTNTEISHDIDGLTAFKMRVVKILEKVSL
jgi:hypothetical protein